MLAGVGALSPAMAGLALSAGAARAKEMKRRGLITAAASFLQSEVRVVGDWQSTTALPKA